MDYELHVREKIKKLRPEYELVGKYNGYNEYCVFKHDVCGNTFEATPHSMLRPVKNKDKFSKNCPFCNKTKRTTLEMLKYKLKIELNDEYELVNDGDYKNLITNIDIRHKKCGKIFNTTLSLLFNRTRCPYCSHRSFKYTTDEVKEEIKNLTNGEYIVLSEYKNEKTPIKIKHTKCNKIFYPTRRNFIYNGTRCPYCVTNNYSKMEYFMKKVLNDYSINYIQNHLLIIGKKYRCDFYLNDYKLILELDGERHFKETRYSDSKSQLSIYKKRDSNKNKICEQNKMSYIRIPYTVKWYEFQNIIFDLYNNNGKLSSTTIEKYNLLYFDGKYVHNYIRYYTDINPSYYLY